MRLQHCKTAIHLPLPVNFVCRILSDFNTGTLDAGTITEHPGVGRKNLYEPRTTSTQVHLSPFSRHLRLQIYYPALIRKQIQLRTVVDKKKRKVEQSDETACPGDAGQIDVNSVSTQRLVRRRRK